MNPKPVTAQRWPKPDAQLHALGIDTTHQPLVNRFPPTFNPAASHIWEAILTSDDYVARRKAEGSACQHLWEYALRMYLRKCGAEDVYPFSNGKDFEKDAKDFLKAARQQLVTWFNTVGIFQHMSIRRVERRYSTGHHKFGVHYAAELRPISDPTFEKWLLNVPEPSFRKHADGVFRRSLDTHLEVSYHLTNSLSYLSYTLSCRTALRDLRPDLSTDEAAHRYIEDHLWLPLVREHRADSVSRILF